MLEAIQQMDVSILLWIQNNLRVDALTPFWKAVTFLGENGWFWILVGLLLLCFKKTRVAGFAVLLALTFGALITNVCLKNLVARMRPYDYSQDIIRLIGIQKDFSFPSGHTCASFAGAITMARMLPKKYGIPALVLAGMIACSRLYLGVHFPTDILGGVLAAAVASVLACAVVRWIVNSRQKMQDNDEKVG